MSAYLAPGVYLRPRRTEQVDVRLVRTDIAGFVGFTERGPLPIPSLASRLRRVPTADDLAVRLTSWDEYRAHFGGLTPYGLLPYSVRGFFENGGTTCRVVRVAAATHADPGQQPSVARWLFRGAMQNAESWPMRDAVAAGTRLLATPLAPAIASGEAVTRTSALIEIIPPDGSASEFHVLDAIKDHPRGGDPLLQTASPLRRSYPSGAAIRLHEAALEIEATSAGNWGNRIRLSLSPLTSGDACLEFALRVTLDPGPDPSHPREEEFYRHLSIERRDDPRRPEGARPVAGRTSGQSNPAFAPDVINGRSRVIRVVYPPQSDDPEGKHAVPIPILVDAALRFGPPIRLAGGRDGLTGVAHASRRLMGGDWLNGLRTLEAIDEVSILCAPDMVLEPLRGWTAPRPPRPAPCAPPQAEPVPDVIAEDATSKPLPLNDDETSDFYASMLDQCERLRDRVALLDAPASARTVNTLLGWRKRVAELSSTARRFGAGYAPWVAVPDPVSGGARRLVPPSGYVAGVYAQVDNAFGVHRPPGNVELLGVDDLAEAITSQGQEELNPRGVNLLRPFPGRGVRVWGARSLSDEPDWRFIHVRRTMSMIEESVEDSTQWAVFEPNDDTLRRTLTHSVSVFLRGIWQAGALKGGTPEEAFYVKCDDTNNPPALVALGQLVCEVGVAIAAPMEFLVFEIRQQATGAEIVEG